MAGGVTTPLLASAVSNAGALGSLAASLLPPDVMRLQIQQIKQLTDQPFLVNLFVQRTPQPTNDELQRAVRLLQPVWSALGWHDLPLPSKWCEDFESQFEVLLEARPAAASFTFDILTIDYVRRLHAAGIFVIGTVTTVAEGLAWQQAGADAVVVSGIESGGHRGTFIGEQTAATLTLAELLPQMARQLRIPLIAAGGVMDGADIAAALSNGAAAVQMGTAFLVSAESGAHPLHKQRLLEAGEQATQLTRSFSGRYARGLKNRFMSLMAEVETQVPAYPVQNALTAAIRAEGAKNGDADWMSLWAGAQVHRARAMSVVQLVDTLMAELHAARKL
jgi:nitronate monooxygenase